MPFFFSGSTSSDFSQPADVENPLPECPGYPNCARTSLAFPGSVEVVLDHCHHILTSMEAQRIRKLISDDRISAVFKVILFKDDFDVQVEPKDQQQVWVHLRSASRIGFGDLGVNRRRIQTFIKRLKDKQ